MSERDDLPPQSDEPEAGGESEKQKEKLERDFLRHPGGLGPPHLSADEPGGATPVHPTGLGPPHASADEPGGGSPVHPTGLGPPHATADEPGGATPVHPTGLGPPHATADEPGGGKPVHPTGLGPPHATADEPGGATPAHPTGLGPPHATADEPGGGKPVHPTGLGPPHATSDEPGGADKPGEPKEPPGPPAPPAHPTGLGPPHATADEPTDAPAEPDKAVSLPPRAFGSALITGVLLTLAGGSAAAGGILALWFTTQLSFAGKALVCAGVALLLVPGAVLLRLVRGSDDLRGTLAMVGIAFAAAGLVFADDPASPTAHDNLVKFALVAGLVAVLGWFAAMVVPSAVAGFMAVVAMAAAAGAGVWLSVTAPTVLEVYITALGVGLALALLLPRVPLLRPHPTGLWWALAAVAVVVAVPAVAITTRGDATALAAGSTASAALLVLAGRYRNLPAALGALAGFATLESVLVTSFVGESRSGDIQLSRLVAVALSGAVLVAVVAAGVLLTARGWSLPTSKALPVQLADVLIVASLALAIVSIFNGPGEVPLSPPVQLLPASAATSGG